MKALLNRAIPKLYGFYFNILAIFSGNLAARKALSVFSIPRKGKINSVQDQFLKTGDKQLIGWDEGLFALYRWKGAGPTVLLLHGWESNAYRWKYLIEPLVKKDYNVIAIDAPAHGGTDGKEFTAIKYAKIIKQTIGLYEPELLIAHSVGAMATIYQEHQHRNDCIKKFVFLGSPNKLEDVMRGYQRLVPFNESVYKALDRLINNTFGMHIKDFNSADFISSINVPTLLVHNPNDAIIAFKSMQEIALQLPQAKTYTSLTGGHSLYTPEVIDAVLYFIEAP